MIVVVPAPTIVTFDPLAVAIVVLALVNVNAPGLFDDGAGVKAASPKFLVMDAKVMVGRMRFTTRIADVLDAV